MKPHIYLAVIGCFTATSINTQAQTTQQDENQSATKTMITTPKFSIGLMATGGIASGYRPFFPTSGRRSNRNSGGELYARYFIGRHWAVESGLGLNMFEKGYGYTYLYDATNHRYDYQMVEGREIRASVPLTFQYHLLNKESRLRPYFLFGAGWERSWFTDRRVHNYEEDNRIGGKIFMQIGQGLTYQINKNWQFNESITVRSGGGTDVMMKFGLGYSFR